MGERQLESGGIGWIAPPEAWLGGARAALSLRRGGISPAPYASLNLGRSVGDLPGRVAENERRLREALQLPGPPAQARLEHGVGVRTVDHPGRYGPTDALVTAARGLPLWLTVADCLPVYFAAAGVIALLHAGWRGAAAGAAAIVVRELARRTNLPPAEQRVWIGPGIGPCCYRVGSDVAAHFAPEAIDRAGGAIHLDLAAAVRLQLEQAGLPREAIAASRLCTSCHPELFFSYRRDGTRSGRMAAVLWL